MPRQPFGLPHLCIDSHLCRCIVQQLCVAVFMHPCITALCGCLYASLLKTLGIHFIRHPCPFLVKGEVLSPTKIRATAGGDATPSALAVKSNMVYTLCKHMVYMLSITNEHKNELEMRAKPEWKVHFLCFASAKRGSFSIR